MFSKKVLEKCSKEELIAKLLETSEKINGKDRIIKSLENKFGKVRIAEIDSYFPEREINRLEEDVEYFKEQTSKVIDNLLEKQDNSRVLKNIETPDKKIFSESDTALC